MPRKKRSEKQAVEVAPKPVAVVPAPAPAMIVAALCRLCGRTIPEKRAIKAGYVTVDRIDYFASIDWDREKPFGIIYPATGRGSLGQWQHIGPEAAPELFQAVKGRLLEAVREFLEKGWVSKEEVEEIIK